MTESPGVVSICGPAVRHPDGAPEGPNRPGGVGGSARGSTLARARCSRQMGVRLGVRRRSAPGLLGTVLAVTIGAGLCLAGCGAAPASRSDATRATSATSSTPGATASPSTTSTATGGRTSEGMGIDPHRDKYGSGLTSVSCPVASFCMASDGSGFIYTLDNGRWSRGFLLASGTGILNAVSCATPSFCAAVAGSSGRCGLVHVRVHARILEIEDPDPGCGCRIRVLLGVLSHGHVLCRRAGVGTRHVLGWALVERSGSSGYSRPV